MRYGAGPARLTTLRGGQYFCHRCRRHRRTQTIIANE